MQQRNTAAVALILVAALTMTPAAEATSRDGRSFDTGATMTEPAPGAPAQLGELLGALGRWRVELRRGGDDAARLATCQAEITLFNRGHGYVERLLCPDREEPGGGVATLALWTYNDANRLWVRGEVDGLAESISVSQGSLRDGRLVLRDAIRPGGGALLRDRRITFVVGTDRLQLTEEQSLDGGATWSPVVDRVYSRSDATPALERRPDFGEPAPGMPPEAREFDFLVGDWIADNELTFPNGQTARWRARATAVHALDGRAILEYAWFDADPQLPDAATTIVRIYNRAMRRWESLYMANRDHGILHFGGRREGGRIVLHPFSIDASSPTISRFVFHSIGSDRFGWYGEQSVDRGKTFDKTWVIDTTRRLEPVRGAAGRAEPSTEALNR